MSLYVADFGCFFSSCMFLSDVFYCYLMLVVAVCWFLMPYDPVCWYPLLLFAVSCCQLLCVAVRCCLMLYFAVFWLALALALAVCFFLMVSVAVCWFVLLFGPVSWCLLLHVAVCCCTLLSSSVSFCLFVFVCPPKVANTIKGNSLSSTRDLNTEQELTQMATSQYLIIKLKSSSRFMAAFNTFLFILNTFKTNTHPHQKIYINIPKWFFGIFLD